MRIGIIDMQTGDIVGIITPQVQLSPLTPADGRALVVIDSHANVAGLTDAEIIEGFGFDLGLQAFVAR